MDGPSELPVISDRDDPGHADPMGVADAYAAGFLSALAAGAIAGGALPGPLP